MNAISHLLVGCTHKIQANQLKILIMSRINKSSHFHVIRHELISEFSFEQQFQQLKLQILKIEGVRNIYINLISFPGNIVVITSDAGVLKKVQSEAKKIGVHLLPKMID